MAQMVKNPPAMQETWVQFLGWEDPLEKEMTICSSIIAWRIPWTEDPGRLQSMGSQRVGHDWGTKHACMSSYMAVVPTDMSNLKSMMTSPGNATGHDVIHSTHTLQTSFVCYLCRCLFILFTGFSRQEYWRFAIPFSRESSWPRNQTQVSCIAGRFFTDS